MPSSENPGKVTPARLSYLSIYNPELGKTNETFRDQVVFYYTKDAKQRRKNSSEDPDNERRKQEEENEKLRQIGLAQGMVHFARSFSDSESVDSVETEKSRLVLHELEKSWWILASIDLTRLPISSSAASGIAQKSQGSEPAVEYSSREVCPPALLINYLKRAHAIFCLHHGASLNELLGRLSRDKFCDILNTFWTRFALNWDVLMHGNPAVDIFNGIKLAAGGELGIGVGEEEWGSGEREVLEHFAGKNDGLVDMVVSRFGEPSSDQISSQRKANKVAGKIKAGEETLPWLGNGTHPNASDGVIFSGMGTISRTSVRDVAHWMQWIFSYGEYTYGVRDNPGSERRKRRRKKPLEVVGSKAREQPSHESANRVAGSTSPSTGPHTKPLNTRLVEGRPGIPPPIIAATEQQPKKTPPISSSERRGPEDGLNSKDGLPSANDSWTRYLTFGYGSTWGKTDKVEGEETGVLNKAKREEDTAKDQSQLDTSSMRHIDPAPETEEPDPRQYLKILKQRENTGHFIIGLVGDLGTESGDEENVDDYFGSVGSGDSNSRTLLRTVFVQVKQRRQAGSDIDLANLSQTSGDESIGPDDGTVFYKASRLRVIVYVHRPFIYTFLFHPRTPSLQLSSFYRTLHNYLSPLHGPLCTSTSPTRVAARIASSSHPRSTVPASSTNPAPIFDLVYDPITLTVHASIPNIPNPGTAAAEGIPTTTDTSGPTSAARSARWNRIDALNVHSQILAIRASAAASKELERTVKTSRGWWIVWMRLPVSTTTSTSTAIGGESVHSDIGGLARSDADTDADTDADADQDEDKRKGQETAASSGKLRSASRSQRPHFEGPPCREAFLVRLSRDAAGSGSYAGVGGLGGRTASAGGGWVGSGMFGFGEKSGPGWGPVRLAEGIGIDARRYVEGLLSLNR